MRKRIDKKTGVILGALALIVLIVLIPGAGKVKTYDIPDRCGRFVNLFSHTIESQSTCEVQCKQLCSSKKLNYYKAQFTEAEAGCHECSCDCKESRW